MYYLHSIFRLSTLMCTLILLTTACTSSKKKSSSHQNTKTSPTFDKNGGKQAFGDALSSQIPVTSLEKIFSEPSAFADKTVQTTGTVKRVCQVMGCWLELEDQKGHAIQIPMAGHAFAIPKNAAGAQAKVEGKVIVKPLTEAEKEHLKKEGAKVLENNIQIEATGVILEPTASPKDPSSTS